MATEYSIIDLPDKIASRIHASPNGCWEWTARIEHDGYGEVWLSGKLRKAHRVTFEALVGAIPTGLQIDHLCRNRKCVNPAHLEPVTQKVNLSRGSGLSALNSAKTSCVHGHEYTPHNTLIEQRGRRCRECRRLQQVAIRAGKTFIEIVQSQKVSKVC